MQDGKILTKEGRIVATILAVIVVGIVIWRLIL